MDRSRFFFMIIFCMKLAEFNTQKLFTGGGPENTKAGKNRGNSTKEGEAYGAIGERKQERLCR